MLFAIDREDALNSNTAQANSTSTSSKKASLGSNNAGTGCRQHIGYRKGMAIASLNVNGLRGNLDEIQLMRHWLMRH